MVSAAGEVALAGAPADAPAAAPATAEPSPASVAGSCSEGWSLAPVHAGSAVFSAGACHGGELCVALGLGTVSEDSASEPLTAPPVSRDGALDPPKELGPELGLSNVEAELGAPNEVGPGLDELGVDSAGEVLEGELEVWFAGRAFAPAGAAAVRSLWQ